MRSFFTLSGKKSVLAIVIISVLIITGILLKNDQQTVSIVQTKTSREFANVTASVDNASPSRNTIINVTVTGPAGAKVKLVCHFKLGDFPYSGVIGDDGKAEIPVFIGAASPGFAVIVDATVIADKIYTAQTMFIPQ